MKCESYHLRRPLYGWADAETPIFGKEYGICWATKEVDPCNCEGDTTKCDFYPVECMINSNEQVINAIKLLESYGYKVIKE